MVNETRACMKKSNVRVLKSSSGYKSYYYLSSNIVSDIVTEITGTETRGGSRISEEGVQM